MIGNLPSLWVALHLDSLLILANSSQPSKRTRFSGARETKKPWFYLVIARITKLQIKIVWLLQLRHHRLYRKKLSLVLWRRWKRGRKISKNKKAKKAMKIKKMKMSSRFLWNSIRIYKAASSCVVQYQVSRITLLYWSNSRVSSPRKAWAI